MSTPDPIALFHGLAPEFIETLLARCEERQLEDGDVLVQPGEDNHHLYILRQGRMSVHLTSDDSRPGFDIAAGECIGEMSIIDGQPVSARVVSRGASQVLAISEAVFWNHLVPTPGIARNLMRQMSARMRARNQTLTQALEQRLAMEHMQKELASAGAIQMGMLPHQRPLFPRHPQVDAHALLIPAKEVGGDLYDAIDLGDGRILAAVGDVSGKGMPASLFMMRSLTLLRSLANAGGAAQDLLPTLNRLLCEANETNMFVTLYLVLLDPRNGRALLLNGGHNLPLLSRAGAPFQVLDQARGALLGMMPGARYQAAEIELAPGDRLLLYSDGVTEAENPEGGWYGLERARALLDAQPATASMECLVEALVAGVQDFAASAPQSDDITLLGLRVPD